MYDALFLLPGCEQIAGENLENYAQLDSLCLSVTEHALGSSLGRYTYLPQLDSLCLSVTEHALGSSLGRYTYRPHGPACF